MSTLLLSGDRAMSSSAPSSTVGASGKGFERGTVSSVISGVGNSSPGGGGAGQSSSCAGLVALHAEQETFKSAFHMEITFTDRQTSLNGSASS